MRRRSNLAQRGPGGFAEVSLFVGQQGEQARRCLMGVRAHIAEYPGRAASDRLALIAQRVDKLRNSGRANPCQGSHHSKPHLVAVTTAAPPQALDEFRRGLVGIRTEISQRGGGPEEHLFLVVVQRPDQRLHGWLGFRTEQRQRPGRLAPGNLVTFAQIGDQPVHLPSGSQ